MRPKIPESARRTNESLQREEERIRRTGEFFDEEHSTRKVLTGEDLAKGIRKYDPSHDKAREIVGKLRKRYEGKKKSS